MSHGYKKAMGFFTTTETQMNLIVLASIAVVVRAITMYLHPGPNPLQKNVYYLLLYLIVTVAAIFIYYRITA